MKEAFDPQMSRIFKIGLDELCGHIGHADTHPGCLVDQLIIYIRKVLNIFHFEAAIFKVTSDYIKMINTRALPIWK